MAACDNVDSRLLQLAQERPGCDLEELAARCSGVTWGRVFLALDRLSRSGQIALKQNGPGHYTVTALSKRPSKQAHVTQH